MTLKQALSVILIVVLSGCKQAALEEAQAAAAGSVQTCLQTFAATSRSELQPAGDRAYVNLSSSYISVLVTEGELGTFGVGSPSYRPIIGCYLSRDPPNTVIFMTVPGQPPLLGTEASYVSIAQEMGAEVDRGEVTEMLFLKNDGEYVFEAAQVWDIENLYRHNPTPQDSGNVITDR